MAYSAASKQGGFTSPSPKPASSTKYCYIPITGRMFQEATKVRQEYQYKGKNLPNVYVCGQVIDIQNEGETIEYHIDDSTGIINAKCFVNDDEQPQEVQFVTYIPVREITHTE